MLPALKDEIRALKKSLGTINAASAGTIAEKIAATGFTCKRCGKCCRSEFGDNTVTVFPSEVRDLMRATGRQWLDIVEPHETGDADERGFYHTFEWALRKKKSGDCTFLEEGRCMVYGHRPLICRTYPMRLEAGGAEVEVYECEGLGTGAMGEVEAEYMARVLVKRCLEETQETISLLEKYEAFSPGHPGPGPTRIYVVHDSEGSRRVRVLKDGSRSFI